MTKPIGEWDNSRTKEECPQECMVCGAKGLMFFAELGFVSCRKHWPHNVAAMREVVAKHVARKAKPEPKPAPRGGFEFL